jgi:hypothetical protein
MALKVGNKENYKMIDFSYKITKVSKDNNFMEIIYSAPERVDVTVGAPLPLSTQNLDDHIKAYAPIGYWTELEIGTVAPEVGKTGSITFSTQTDVTSMMETNVQAANIEFEKQIAATLVKFGVLETDPTITDSETP